MSQQQRAVELKKLLFNVCDIGKRKCDEEASFEGLKEILKLAQEARDIMIELVELGEFKFVPEAMDAARRIQMVETLLKGLGGQEPTSH